MAKNVAKRNLRTKFVNLFGVCTNKQHESIVKELADLREEVAYSASQDARNTWNPDKKPPNETDFLKATHHNEWYYGANFIMSNVIAMLPFTLTVEEEDENGEKKRVPAPENDLSKLFARPDPVKRATWNDLIEGTQSNLDTCGNGYWLVWHDKNPKYKEYCEEGEKGFYRIRLLRPDQMHPKCDKKTGDLEGWLYKPGRGKKRQVLEIDNVVHFSYFNALHDWQGLAPAMPAWDSIEALRSFNRLNRRLIENDFNPGVFLETDKEVDSTPDQRISVASQIDSKHRGANKTGKTIAMPPGMTAKALLEQKDVQWEKLFRIMILNLSAATGVPAALLGLHEQYNRANMKSILKLFFKYRVMPRTRKIADKINTHLVPLLAPELVEKGLKFAFDFSGVEALQEDPKDAAVAKKAAVGRPWKTPNEARTEIGMPAKVDDPSADELYVKATPGMQIPEAEEEEAEKGEESILEWFEPLDRVDWKRAAADPVGFRIWRAARKVLAPIESAVIAKMHRKGRLETDAVLNELEKWWYKWQREGVIQKSGGIYVVRKAPILPQQEFDAMMKELQARMAGEGDWLVEALEPGVEEAMVAGAARGAGVLEAGFEFDLLNANIGIYRSAMGTRIRAEIPSTTMDKLHTSMYRGYELGEGITELAERVKSTIGAFTGRTDWRAELIARTETTAAFNFGSVESYRQAKVDGTKHWIAAFDDRVRDWHIDVQSVKGRDEPFTVFGPSGPASMMYPGDMAGGAENSCNCRCCVSLVPA